MEFYYYTPETFVVLTDDQFVEGDGLFEQHRQECLRRNAKEVLEISQQIDRQPALQTSQKEYNNRI